MVAITLGLPVYNSERSLRESLDSLLGQTFKDFVLIISDNASTDSTGAICEEYARRDSRIRYSRNARNIGLSGNFNRVAELTETPYLKWATADDLWAPTMLERAYEVMERDPSIALCYPKTTLVDRDGANSEAYEDNLHLMSDKPVERFVQLLQNIRLCHQHLGLIRTAHLRRTLMLGSYGGSDRDFLAELALYGKFYELPERLFFRRMHELSSSWARGDEGHQRSRYHSAQSAQIKMTSWRQHLRLLWAVLRSPLGIADKQGLVALLLKRMLWDRERLVEELRHKVAPSVGRRKGADT